MGKYFEKNTHSNIKKYHEIQDMTSKSQNDNNNKRDFMTVCTVQPSMLVDLNGISMVNTADCRERWCTIRVSDADGRECECWCAAVDASCDCCRERWSWGIGTWN